MDTNPLISRKNFLVAGLMGVASVAGLAACGTSSSNGSGANEQKSNETLETADVTLDGLYVDDSFTSESSESLRLLYAFFTLHPEEVNMEPSVLQFELTAGKNDYDVKWIAGARAYINSYDYALTGDTTSNSLGTVYAGDEKKISVTFLVTEADLEDDSEITFTNSSITGIDELKVMGSSVEHCESHDALAQTVDPEGYAEEATKREVADADTTAAVQNTINGYEYWASTSSYTVRCEFQAPNRYTMTFLGKSGSGTYEVRNGYIALTSDNLPDNPPSLCPWSWKDDGGISIDLLDSVS